MQRRFAAVIVPAVAFAIALLALRVGDRHEAQSAVGAATPAALPEGSAAQTWQAPTRITHDLIKQLSDPEATSAAATVAASSAVAPLPAWDAALHEVLPMLRARADAGDAAAACHLGLALSACAYTGARRAGPALLRTLDPNDPDAIDDVARSSIDPWRNGREATCAGVSDADLDLRFQYLRRAAEAGNEAAMLGYAEAAPFLSYDAMVRHVDWIEQYRLDTPRYVAELLRRGDRRAAVWFARDADGFQATLLSQLLLIDARTAATLHQLGQRVRGDAYTDHHQMFTLDQLRLGRGRAEAIFQHHFADRPPARAELRNESDLFDVTACTVAS